MATVSCLIDFPFITVESLSHPQDYVLHVYFIAKINNIEENTIYIIVFIYHLVPRSLSPSSQVNNIGGRHIFLV